MEVKDKTIFLIIIGVIILGLTIYGYLKAIPGIEDQKASRSQIEITPNSFDFGNVKYGEIAEHTFKIKNIGDLVLEIKKVATSCACTTAEVGQMNLDSQQETELKVIYDTGAMSGSHAKGQQERIIYIRSNDPINPQIEVVITAFVE